jgi:hypothetical protein
LVFNVRNEGNSLNRLTGRSKWAGVIALLIFLMNVFPFATFVHAEALAPGDLSPGSVKPGHIDPGDVKPGDVTPGDLQWETGSITPGEMQPGVMLPGSLESGSMQPGSVQPGDMQPGSLESGSTQPGSMQPGSVKPGSVDPGNVNGKQESKSYDYIKWSFKDTIGGSLQFASDLTMQGEVTPNHFAWNRGLFLAEVGIKAVDIHLKDTDFDWASGVVVDGFDGLASWANAQFIQDVTGNIEVPGVVKGLNVTVAGISFVFDSIDTFQNFGEALDSDNSREKRIEASIEGVGSLGSTLVDAAVIAALVPGGQTVATVLVLVGGTLWLGSRLVKWSRKIYKLFA